MLVQIPETGHFVNPRYVTHIEPDGKHNCRVYVVSHAGYGTAGIWTSADAATVASLINAQPPESSKA